MEDNILRENILIGMGNPLLDISANVDKAFLAKYEMKENDAILADEKHKNLYNDLSENQQIEYIAGGSVQNTLRVAQWLIGKPKVTTYFGCIGQDKYGKILSDKALGDGVNVRYQYSEKEPTGTCAVLITGHNRSLCANLASANCFTIDHIRKPDNKVLLETAQFFYISGFFLTVSPPSIMETAKIALTRNCPLLMNLSAPFICQHFVQPLMEVMPYVDVIFGNETEAEALATSKNFNTKDLKEIALKIASLPKQNESRSRIVILTQGIHPVIVAKDGKITEYPVTPMPPEKLVDTNGAGDAFAGGFLAQFIQGRDLSTCVKCGIWTAAQIIQRSGCTFEGTPSFQA